MKKIILVIIITIFSLNFANANYERNINDEIKVFNIEKKIEKFLRKYSIEKQKIIKNKVKLKIESILKMNEKEIKNINNYTYKKIKINSFKDYLLIRIYNDLNGTYYAFKGYKIIETNYAKILVYLYNEDKKIIVTSDGFFFDGNKYQFFNLPKGIDTSLFIKQKFIGKFLGKCEVEKINKYTFRFMPFGNYMKGKDNIEKAGSCGFRAYSNFQKISENILMYSEFGQEWNGVDLSTIEIKQNINLAKDKIVKDFGNGLIVRKRGENNFLYNGYKLISFAGENEIFDKVELGLNGTYILVKNNNGNSRFIAISTSYLNKVITGKIKDFELMTNKRVKLIYSNGNSKIIKLD